MFIDHNIAGNENSLSRNPKHRVFIGVTLDVLKDGYLGALKVNEVAAEGVDSNNVRRRSRAQGLFPFIYFLLIDRVYSVYYRRSCDDSHASSLCLNPDFLRDAILLCRRPRQGRYNAPQEGG